MARPKAGVTFWDRVYSHTEIKYGDNPFSTAEGCHLFKGHRNADGYGRIYRDGKLVFVHREIWKEAHGQIPEKMNVCHKCDTPNCINIHHLFLGTQAENVADMWAKGRGENLRRFGNTHTRGKSINSGSKHGLSIFTEEQAQAIKDSFKDDNSWGNVVKQAKVHECSTTAINHIRAGTRWKHLK